MSVIVIAGGGTGGHIYPGLAVAKILREQGHDVHWVGAQGGLEEKLVVRDSVPLHLIRIGKLHHSVGLWTQVKTVLGFPRAFIQAFILALQLKPQAVLGVGGFASGPFLFVAALLRRRTVIWEPNAKAGLANRVLSRIVDECLLVFSEAKADLNSKKIYRVGLPVRDSIKVSHRPAPTGRAFRILAFGGSQGAKAINRAIASWVISDKWSMDFELVHQTGSLDFNEIKKIYEGIPDPQKKRTVTCVEYIHDMEKRYAWADLIICRAGASTAAEIAASGKAAIFIPLPSAADDHQLKNAKVFERAGAAAVIEQKNLSVESLNEAVRRFQKDPVLVEQFEHAVQQFATLNSATIIAEHVVGSSTNEI